MWCSAKCAGCEFSLFFFGLAQIVDLEEVILPGNARLFHHDAECFDWGTLGWIMSAGMVDVQDYKYFVMVNSGVRGPYALPYEPGRGRPCQHESVCQVP